KKENREPAHESEIENVTNDNDATIGMLAIDKDGRISGACSSSGMGYEMPGRVGDSAIIGAGLFIDGAVGGATATGKGEFVMKTLGSFLVVEFMRNGLSPSKACEEAVRRIARKIPDYQSYQTGYIALNAKGEYGSFSIQPGFTYAIKTTNKTEMVKAESWLKKL
ncbi:MAG TPA: isoaspartyl peptidase/L-asparaginase, partial [Draconibacterium sp.]|nr:isoaspartyl peptidase/L-asparaginase [Draconibacterium sp.]